MIYRVMHAWYVLYGFTFPFMVVNLLCAKRSSAKEVVAIPLFWAMVRPSKFKHMMIIGWQHMIMILPAYRTTHLQPLATWPPAIANMDVYYSRVFFMNSVCQKGWNIKGLRKLCFLKGWELMAQSKLSRFLSQDRSCSGSIPEAGVTALA